MVSRRSLVCMAVAVVLPISIGGPRRPAAPAVVYNFIENLSRASALSPGGPAAAPDAGVPGSASLPRIDAFAAEALLLENAIAQAPWTTSSVSSMLTGVFPNTHHVTLPQHALPASLATAGEILHDAGFMTAAFITNAAAGEAFGLARGFTEHRLLQALGYLE